jgi:hypothetical protein
MPVAPVTPEEISEAASESQQPAPAAGTTPVATSAVDALTQAFAGEGDETPAVPVTAAEPQAPAAEGTTQQPTAADLRAMVREKYGIDTSNYSNDDALLEGLVNARRKLSERDELAQIGKQYAPFREHLDVALSNYFSRQDQQLAQPQVQQEQPKGWYNPPPAPAGWEKLVEVDDETGAVKVKDGVRPDVRDQILAHVDYRREWQTKILTNPVEALQPLYQQAVEEAQQRALEAYEARQAQLNEQSEAKRFIAENKGWMFQQNESGQFLRTENGGFAPTEAGRFFYGELQTFSQMGIPAGQAQALAFRNTQLAYGGGQQQAQSAAPATPAQPAPVSPTVTLPVAPTKRAVPPGAGGNRNSVGVNPASPPGVGVDARQAFMAAFEQYNDQDVRDTVLQ